MPGWAQSDPFSGGGGTLYFYFSLLFCLFDFSNCFQEVWLDLRLDLPGTMGTGGRMAQRRRSVTLSEGLSLPPGRRRDSALPRAGIRSVFKTRKKRGGRRGT